MGNGRRAGIAGLVVVLLLVFFIAVRSRRAKSPPEPAPEAPAARTTATGVGPDASPSPSPASAPSVRVREEEEPNRTPGADPSGMRTLRGTIARSDGQPVRRAKVTLMELTRGRGWVRIHGRVREDGSFEIPGVPEELLGASVKVTAGAEGFLVQMFRFTEIEKRLRIVLVPPVRYSGRLVDEEGQPVSKAWFSAFYTPFDHFSATSDADGRFSFLAPAEWGGLVQVSGLGFPRFRFVLPHDAVVDRDLGEITAARGGSISGLLLDVEDRPISGVAVVLHARIRGEKAGRTTTDENGRFAFEGVGPGPHDAATLFMTAEGERRGAREVALTAGQRDVRLRAGPVYEVTLQLLHKETGRPVWVVIAGAAVRAAGDPADHTWHREWSGRRVSITLKLARKSRHIIRLSTPFYSADEIEVEVGPEARKVVDLLLTPRDDG